MKKITLYLAFGLQHVFHNFSAEFHQIYHFHFHLHLHLTLFTFPSATLAGRQNVNTLDVEIRRNFNKTYLNILKNSFAIKKNTTGITLRVEKRRPLMLVNSLQSQIKGFFWSRLMPVPYVPDNVGRMADGRILPRVRMYWKIHLLRPFPSDGFFWHPSALGKYLRPRGHTF